MKVQNFCFYLLLAGFILFLNACQKEDSMKEKKRSDNVESLNKASKAEKWNTFYGHQVQLGEGKVRSFVTISHAGVPKEIGIEMTEGALSGLSMEHANYVLPLHKKASEVTPFDHIYFNWNPHGHPPFFFEEPHFDIHFYMVSVQERMQVSTTSSLMNQIPPQPYWPQGFVPTEGGEAQMGKHWINPLSPEICCNQPFTHTMIWGSYAGEMTFIEPMVTQAFLQSGANVHMPFGQPDQVMQTGTYYPTSYNVYERNGKHYVSLSDFVLR